MGKVLCQAVELADLRCRRVKLNRIASEYLVIRCGWGSVCVGTSLPWGWDLFLFLGKSTLRMPDLTFPNEAGDVAAS